MVSHDLERRGAQLLAACSRDVTAVISSILADSWSSVPGTTTASPVYMGSTGFHSAAERRAHRRAPLDVPALVDFATFWRRSRCRDVSEGGVSVELTEAETSTLVPLGKELDIYFELPVGIAIETRAQVVRRSGSELGLRFVGLDPEFENALAAYCRALGRAKKRSGIKTRR